MAKKPAGTSKGKGGPIDTSFDFGYNLPGVKPPKVKKARPKTGPRTWKGQQYGS